MNVAAAPGESDRRDLAILHGGADAPAAEELFAELRLLGTRVSRTETRPRDLPARIAEALHGHSAVLLFLTQTFAEELVQNEIDLSSQPPSVVPLTYGVNANLRKRLESRIDGVIPTLSRTLPGFALKVLAELAAPGRRIDLAPARSLATRWESPLFLYRKNVGYKDHRYVLVDVTWSAKPIQSEPAELVLRVFRKAIDHIGDGPYNILDFGAGKLRYSLFWLGQGKRVTAVDYPEPFERPTEEIRRALDEAEGNTAFDRVVYPSQLLAGKAEEFDVALLINVISIVPDPLERLFILSQCNDKLKLGGHLIWFHYYGDLSQMEAASDRVTDGGCTQAKGRKTFYKNLPKEEAVRLANVMGFDEVGGLHFDVDKNIAGLFRKARAPVGDVASMARARRDLLGRMVVLGESDSENVVADVLDAEEHSRLGDFLAHSLSDVEAGRVDAYRYEALVFRIVEYVFHRHFNGPEITEQHSIAGGRQRVDLKANWRQHSALKAILEQLDLASSWVPIECKSYGGSLAGPEFAQIVLRCNKKSRHFGMIFCRKLNDSRKVLDRCIDCWVDHGYLIVVFSDDDLRTMLRFTDLDQDAELVSYVRKRIEKVHDRTP